MNTYDAALQTERDKSARDMEICKRYVVCDVPDERCANCLCWQRVEYYSRGGDVEEAPEVFSSRVYARNYETSHTHKCVWPGCTTLVTRRAKYCRQHYYLPEAQMNLRHDESSRAYNRRKMHRCAEHGCDVLVSRQARYCRTHGQYARRERERSITTL